MSNVNRESEVQAAAEEQKMSDSSLAWRQHFGNDAADVIAIACHYGGFDLKDVLLRCFKRSRRSQRIAMPTVESVLQEIRDESKENA